MHVYCKLYLTNVGPSPAFQILDVSIRKPKTQGVATPSSVGLTNPTKARLAFTFETRFTVEPPVVKSGEPFIADVVLVDQFAKRHIAKKVEFRATGVRGWAAL